MTMTYDPSQLAVICMVGMIAMIVVFWWFGLIGGSEKDKNE